MSAPEALRALIEKIEDIGNRISEATVRLSRAIEQTAQSHPDPTPEMFLLTAVKSQIRLPIRQVLSDTPYCSGAGFASHIESTAYWLLEWWYRRGDGGEQASLELDQATQQRLDFRTFEWFSHTPGDGKATVYGPYVDYICNTAYTLTSALPVYAGERFLGVAAVDILVARLERELLACADGQRVVLTNREQRIIFSTCPRQRTGDLLRDPRLRQVYQHGGFLLYQA